ncbi:MAG TPA: 50S ribosomal protein L15 [Candidatus Limnocylindrales bacterium]|nr:50S ribosomal protein L15 [Candidatus Limnocylindrales bacterium]
MQLDSMKPAPGSRQKRKRLGRGPGSGLGKTSGKGHKGQGARSGGAVTPGFEGGQMPLARRLPKFGFKNPNRVQYQVINIGELAQRFEAGAVVNADALREQGLAKRTNPIKILGHGKLDRALTVEADAFSASAREAIEKAGGSVQIAAAEPAEQGQE